MKLKFLGAGGASRHDLGNASAVLENNNNTLCIDYGFLTANTFVNEYKRLPDAVFITHCHFDHIGGLEALFCAAKIRNKSLIKLYVPASIICRLHDIVANSTDPWANSTTNFWDVFQLIPVREHFFWNDLRFTVISVNHHTPYTAFSLCLPGKFFFTGDTRPIPEVLSHYANANELIFHDAGREPNPSHCGVKEIADLYREDIKERIWIYHHNHPDDIDFAQQLGFKAVKPMDEFIL